MSEEGTKKKSKVWLFVIIALVLIAIVGVVIFFVINSNDIRNVTLTAENYSEITEKVAQELKDSDDLYYLAYSVMSYSLEDGFANLLSGDETAMYKRIYGKTVKQLISEGKQLMKEKDVTIDDFKKGMEEMDTNLNMNTIVTD